jgi:hypothetical protein
MDQPPNPRVQWTRPLGSLGGSPLDRRPFGEAVSHVPFVQGV